MKKFGWKLKEYFEQNGRMLFNSYDLENSGCLSMRNYVFMMFSEIMNNNHKTSLCQNCMKQTKNEVQALFDYLDADGNGQVTAQDLFNSFKQFNTIFPVTSTMVNSFILINDQNGKAALNREEFVNGIVLGMTERELTKFGWTDSKTNLKNVRKVNADHQRGPQ